NQKQFGMAVPQGAFPECPRRGAPHVVWVSFTKAQSIDMNSDRTLGLAVAQMGPVHLADSREAVVRRLIEMLREAKGRGAGFVVFPELALTTFFPRYWIEDQDELDRFYERTMPNPQVQPL